MHSYGRDEILGTAYSDHDLVVFLVGVGIADLEAIFDDPVWVEGGVAAPPRQFSGADDGTAVAAGQTGPAAVAATRAHTGLEPAEVPATQLAMPAQTASG
ncbi:hypothetical protein ACFVZC_26875 [Streptomyces marokkonensis]|uniref:Uncharacterized protein n=1 Tax=Streptomyces marokkonensis TaxID=324855 RepID=A0ABW6QE14_9ACTN